MFFESNTPTPPARPQSNLTLLLNGSPIPKSTRTTPSPGMQLIQHKYLMDALKAFHRDASPSPIIEYMTPEEEREAECEEVKRQHLHRCRQTARTRQEPAADTAAEHEKNMQFLNQRLAQSPMTAAIDDEDAEVAEAFFPGMSL